MTSQLDPDIHPWLGLVSLEDLAGMRADLESGIDPEHCSHGDLVEDVVRQWRRFALDSVVPPTDWTKFDLSAELWFGFLQPGEQAECRADFATALSDNERGILFCEWRSTGAILSDPVLAERLLESSPEPPGEEEL
jgi:hypothetical protein